MKTMKKAAVILVTVAFFLGFGAYAVLYSHWFPKFLVSQWIHAQNPALKLQSFNFKKRSFHFWDEIIFRDIHLILKDEKSTYDFLGESLDFSIDLQNKVISLDVEGASIKAQRFKAKDIEMAIVWCCPDGQSEGHWEGTAEIASFNFASYHLEKIVMNFEGEGKEIYSKSFWAQGYGGNIEGKIFIQTGDFPVLFYDIDLDLSNMDSKELRLINDNVFSQMDGILDGKIQIKGAGKRIETLKGEMNIHPGGKMKASLLGLIVPYIPQSAQKKDLEKLIKANGEIPIDKAALRLNNIGEESLSTTVDLESKRLNLDLALTVDINLDAPLGSLFSMN